MDDNERRKRAYHSWIVEHRYSYSYDAPPKKAHIAGQLHGEAHGREAERADVVVWLLKRLLPWETEARSAIERGDHVGAAARKEQGNG